jgi:hypothetical protein
LLKEIKDICGSEIKEDRFELTYEDDGEEY